MANKTIITAKPGIQEVRIEREFDAPCELVFSAYTDPELYVQWLDPRGYTMTLETFAPRPGGAYRYIQKDAAGQKFAFHGVYHEVRAPERIINTFEFEGLPEAGYVALETVRFERLPDNRTRVKAQSVFQTITDRDGMVATGMVTGQGDGHARLDEVLKRVQQN